MAGITRDATAGWFFPASSGEWTEFVRGSGIAVADAAYDLQEASGNFTDMMGSGFTLTAGAGLAYQQAFTGFSRLAVSFGENTTSNAASASASLPDVLTASLVTLGIWNLTTPSAIRNIYENGTGASVRGSITTTPRQRVTIGVTGTGVVAGITGAVRIIASQIDRTNNIGAIRSDIEHTTITPSAGTGKGMRWGGSGAGLSACPGLLTYACAWFNANAEMSQAQFETIFKLFKQGPALSPLYFDMGGPKAVPPIVNAWRQYAAISEVFAPITAGTPAAATQTIGFLGVEPAFNEVTRSHAAFQTSEVAQIPTVPVGPEPPPDSFYGAEPSFNPVKHHTAFAPSIADLPRVPIGAPPLPDPFYGVMPSFEKVRRHPSIERQSKIAEPPRPTVVLAETLRSKVVGLRPRFDYATGRDSRHPGYRTHVHAPIYSLTAARGGAMAYVFTFDPEVGGSVTYSWATDVIPLRAGLESRIALRSVPREAYAFEALLEDHDLAVLQSKLVTNQANASLFGVALMHESLTLVASTSGSTVTVPTTTYSDWCVAGQTAQIIAPDGTSGLFIVQGKTANAIALDVSVGSLGVVGARIMPVIPSYLEDVQAISVFANNAGRYSLRARASYFGNNVNQWNPGGAVVTSYVFPSMTIPVWAPSIVIDSTSARATIGGTELIDRGGALLLHATKPAVDWTREIKYRVYTDADRQYLKKFGGTVKGQQKVFGLPTYKPDLVCSSGDASGGILNVVGSSAAGSIDYVRTWFLSAPHRFLCITTDQDIGYVEVTDCVDNLDGTQTLQLSSGVDGVISKISFLELCRFETDDLMIAYNDDDVGQSVIPCKVVQR